VIVLALVIAVAAALRSTWSPCGVSMLSTLVPLAEQGRGNRWGVTATWFIAGSTIGGVLFGMLAAPAAALLDGADLSVTTAALVAAGVALVAIAADQRVLGFRLPGHTRQVNEDWLAIYRPWVYAGGFGLQIGIGVATFTVTAGVYVTLVYAALVADPAAAVLVGTVFGLTRGLVVLLGAPLDEPARMRSFHRRFEAAREPSRVAMSLVLAAVAVAGGVLAGGLLGAVGVVAVLGVLAVAQLLARSGARSASSAASSASSTDARIATI
jgi:hypothetical protein